MISRLGAFWLLLTSLPVTTIAVPFEKQHTAKHPKLHLNLTRCSEDLALTTDFECGTLAVPIDHDDKRQGTIDLFVSRRRANGTSGSLGNLVFNMGGPGAGAVSVFQQLAQGLPAFSREVLETFDIIAVDPRGIGLSNPLLCNKDLWNNQPTQPVTDEKSFNKLVAFNRGFGESCLKLTGPLAGFMDSVSTVKDWELLRLALGDGPFNYLGYSYGTLLGQTYAELYPEHVGRMILDAAVDHSVAEDMYQIMTEGQTYQATLERFFSWCESSSECSIAGKNLPEVFKKLTASDNTIPAPGCPGKCQPAVTGGDILARVQTGLAFNDGVLGSWSSLAEAINQAIHGNATLLSRPLATDDMDPTGEIGFANRAVFCQDWTTSVKSAIDIQRISAVASSLLPLTKGAGQALDAKLHCVGWPAPVRNPPRKLNAHQVAKLPSVMIVNSFLDPESSAVWAESLKNQIPASVSIWRNGTGHTSYLLYGETSHAMSKFLIQGTMPKDGTVFNS